MLARLGVQCIRRSGCSRTADRRRRRSLLLRSSHGAVRNDERSACRCWLRADNNWRWISRPRPALSRKMPPDPSVSQVTHACCAVPRDPSAARYPSCLHLHQELAAGRRFVNFSPNRSSSSRARSIHTLHDTTSRILERWLGVSIFRDRGLAFPSSSVKLNGSLRHQIHSRQAAATA